VCCGSWVLSQLCGSPGKTRCSCPLWPALQHASTTATPRFPQNDTMLMSTAAHCLISSQDSQAPCSHSFKHPMREYDLCRNIAVMAEQHCWLAISTHHHLIGTLLQSGPDNVHTQQPRPRSIGHGAATACHHHTKLLHLAAAPKLDWFNTRRSAAHASHCPGTTMRALGRPHSAKMMSQLPHLLGPDVHVVVALPWVAHTASPDGQASHRRCLLHLHW
jgi:hypothetical protein